MSESGNRVPLRSIRGSTPDATEALKELIYLDEVERQAELYNVAFSDAMRTAARGDAFATFRHIQTSLFSAIIVYRLVTNQGTKVAAARSERLRSLLLLEGAEVHTPILSMSRVRDHLEHFDERLDAAVRGPASSLSDWYLADRNLIVSDEPSESRTAPRTGLRAFSHRLGTLYFDDQHLSMLQLDIDMLKLRCNVIEARSDLKTRIPGRNEFGGGRSVVLPGGNPVDAWRKRRAELLREIARVPTASEDYGSS